MSDVNELRVLCITSQKPKLCSSYDLNRASAVGLVCSVHPHVHLCVFCPLSATCWLCRSLSRRKTAFLLKTRPKTPHSSMCCALPHLPPSSCMTRHSRTWTKVRQNQSPHSRGRTKPLNPNLMCTVLICTMKGLLLFSAADYCFSTLLWRVSQLSLHVASDNNFSLNHVISPPHPPFSSYPCPSGQSYEVRMLDNRKPGELPELNNKMVKVSQPEDTLRHKNWFWLLPSDPLHT